LLLPHLLRRHPLLALIAAVLLVSVGAGFAADAIATSLRPAIDRARSLSQEGRFDQAERLYLDLAAQRPGDVPLCIELLDNHEHLVRFGIARKHAAPAELETPLPTLSAPVDEARIDSLLASPALVGDGALLVRWWRLVITDRDADEEETAVIAAAERRPPAPWANHLLGRAADREGRESDAAESFAREASAFADRRGDATAACHIWIDAGEWERLGTALGDAQFAQQVPAVVRMQMAVHSRYWAGAARWFFASQYERTTTGILLLAGLAGVVWFGFCALVGRVHEHPRLRVPLHVAAFGLGVLSTYLTIALAILEETVLHFTEKGLPAADAIYYVFGVGLREELAKALLFLPLVPILKRFGTRRDALACGALVGLGFAAEENLGYFHLGLSTALARFLTANFLHLSTTGIVAVAIDDAVRGRDDEITGWSQTLPLVVITHGVYDFFLSSSVAGSQSSFVSMLCFVLLARRFVNVIRQLPGREGPLLPFFLVGLAVVAGGTFVYAATLVGVAHAGSSIAIGALGLVIVAYVFGREFGSVSR
jgi:RsiW-degrading membrane proteinase PrsW (M82 family)